MAKEAHYDIRWGTYYFMGGKGTENARAAEAFVHRLQHIFRAKQFSSVRFSAVRERLRDGSEAIGVNVADPLGAWAEKKNGGDDTPIIDRAEGVVNSFTKVLKDFGYVEV